MKVEMEVRGGLLFIPSTPWAVLFEGLGIIALGIVLAAWPGASLTLVRVAFGILALAFAAVQVFATVSDKREDRWWRVPLAVLAGAAGIAALAWPDATERVVLIILGLWFMLTGAVLLAAGLRLPGDIPARWVVVAAGAVLFVFGLVLVVNPADKSPREMASTLVVLIGAFAIAEGLIMALYAILLRRALKALEELAEAE
ncbi:MAG: DUF308 domain-containing protein [Actinobacteria bacterium]|nr:DUF308 domain-containing protein [Actinomycetota bacterium]MDI6831459.1 DUF308 domain-containing protein [Actinomycetota bacterium]